MTSPQRSIPTVPQCLLSTCICGEDAEPELDTLTDNAVKATEMLQNYLGHKADAIVLVDAPKPAELGTKKPLKAGTP